MLHDLFSIEQIPLYDIFNRKEVPMSIPGYGPTGTASGLKGTGYKQVSLPTMSPQQMQLFQQVFSGIQPGLSSGLSQLSGLAGGGEDYFSQLEAPALRQFGQLQGNIASRFSGMGSGARRSSGFQNEMGGAAAGLAEKLAGQRMGLQQDAISQLLGLYSDLMGQQTSENFLVPRQQRKKWYQSLLGGSLPFAGTTAGGLLGGVPGAALGASLGGASGQAF